MSDKQPDDEAEVQRRLAEIQRRKRGKVRWNLSRHTAEVALEALGLPGKSSDVRAPATGKQRRRKRHKRLL